MNSLIKKQYVDSSVFIQCPVCRTGVNTVRYAYFQDAQEYKIYRCNSCSFMFSRPAILIDLDQRRMDSIGDAELFNSQVLKKLHEQIILKKEIAKVKKIYGGRTGLTLLDVGCGTGWITEIWGRNGFMVTGLEPSSVRRRIAEEKYGLTIVSDYFEKFASAIKFDIVIMRHVIEHFENPQEMLVKARSHLNPGGLILVIVPNIDSVGRYLFDTKWTWVLPHHCNFFNPRSMDSIIKNTGFEIFKKWQTPSPLWYPESFLRLFPYTKKLSAQIYRKLNFIVLLPFIPIVTLGYLAGLGDNITIIAKGK